MDFFGYIKKAKEKAGSQKKLAEAIGVSEPAMSAMSKGKVPIPADGLRKMATLLGDGTTPGQIWEAQQAARAETEEERQLWLPFLNKAACIALAAGAFCVTYPAETLATPSAATVRLFIMSSLMQVKRALGKMLRKPHQPLFALGICQI